MEGQKQEEIVQFWKEFKVVLKCLEQRVMRLKHIGSRICDSTIAETALPLGDARELLKLARALGLENQFCWQFGKLVELMETIDRYMAMGEEKLNNKWMGNLRCETEQLYTLILQMKDGY